MPDFLSSLVHELRTPLTSLRGALSLLSGVADDGSEDVRGFSAIADRGAAWLASILDDVAAYARLQQTDVPVAFAAVDLTSLLERTAERVQPLAETRGVTIEVRRPSVDASGNEAMLRDAVSRMLFYAVRVTPRDGLVRVNAELAGGRTVIRVADQGNPVSDADLESLFEPFSLVARRGANLGNRTGLDLAIAKLIAEQHGGTLGYRQITGGGVIRLTL